MELVTNSSIILTELQGDFLYPIPASALERTELSFNSVFLLRLHILIS